MPKKRGNKQTAIKVGNISDVSGNINVAGGDVITHQRVADSEENKIEESRLAGNTTTDAPLPEKRKKQKGK